MADFIQGGGYMPFARGTALIAASRDINLGMGGAVRHGEAAGWDMVPILWAGAIPSAHVRTDAYESITAEILNGLAGAGPLDGVFLDLHGAMVAEHEDDGEGRLLEQVRALVGPDVYISCALDLHGNITARMVAAADALVGFRTYPHVDMADTGRRAAERLSALMAQGPRAGTPPCHAFHRVPFLIPIAWQCTYSEPAKGLFDLLTEVETGAVTSVSFFPGFPAADFGECGPTVIAYAETQAEAEAAAQHVLTEVLAAEPAFIGQAYDPDDAVKLAMRIAETATRPVVLADTQDNPGAGGTSDTTGMLRALVANDAPRAALGLIADPAAAEAAHAAGVGAVIDIALGGRSGAAGDMPFNGRFTVEHLSDGNLIATGPYFGGAPLMLGPSACLKIGDVRVVVTTHKAQLADQEMFRFVGIEPCDQAILVNKSSNHFRADFDPIAETTLTCTAPGAMPLSPASLRWKHLPAGLRLEPMGAPFQPESP